MLGAHVAVANQKALLAPRASVYPSTRSTTRGTGEVSAGVTGASGSAARAVRNSGAAEAGHTTNAASSATTSGSCDERLGITDDRRRCDRSCTGHLQGLRPWWEHE